MRALSDRELELIVGGYGEDNGYNGDANYYSDVSQTSEGYDVNLQDTVGQQTLDQVSNNAASMGESQFNDYAVATAQGFGISIGGGATVTPVIDPFGKNKKFKIKLKIPC